MVKSKGVPPPVRQVGNTGGTVNTAGVLHHHCLAVLPSGWPPRPRAVLGTQPVYFTITGLAVHTLAGSLPGRQGLSLLNLYYTATQEARLVGGFLAICWLDQRHLFLVAQRRNIVFHPIPPLPFALSTYRYDWLISVTISDGQCLRV